MQTFMPYPDFVKSAQCLDNKRLGKQRVECKQIYLALENPYSSKPSKWVNHPAVQMWKGHLFLLLSYGMAICFEWRRRGFKDSLMPQFDHWEELHIPFGYSANNPVETPKWFGDERFHASHRSNLLRKDPVHYGQFGWTEPNNLPYFWPTKEKEYQNNHLQTN